MKLTDPLLPINPETVYDRQLSRSLLDFFRKVTTKVNGIASGKIADSADNAATSAPTAGTYVQGDFVRNSAPVEAGTAGSKYVVFGYVCVASGTPGTWVACRFLTGN